MQRADLVAGLSVSGLMLPEAVAYAAIAGLPTERAIFAGVAGCLAYAAVGRSRFAIVSPTSSSAAILAATLATMSGGGALKADLATAAVLLSGAFFLIAAGVRLSGLTGLVSHPVLRGFAFGLAVTIIMRQLPALIGIETKATDIWHIALAAWWAWPDWNAASVGVGGVALVALTALKRYPALPGAFLVLAAGVAASLLFHLPEHGVAIVGTFDAMPVWPSLPALDFADWSRLAQYVLPLALILFAESWGTISGLALRHGDRVAADRELGALGAANIASALVHGMPVGAGFSAGSASEAAGAASRATTVVAALGLAALIAAAAPLVAALPQPVVAAVVIWALSRALDPTPFVRLWRLRRDAYIAMAAAAAVIAFGILNGTLMAIALSLAAVIRRLATPRVARLGRLGETRDYVDVARHKDAKIWPEMTIWRLAQPLFFGNAEAILNRIAILTRANPQTRAIIVSLEECYDLDSTSLDALLAFDAAMRVAGIRVQLARVHDHVRDVLAAGGASDLLTRCSYSVDDAVEALRPVAGQ